MFNKLTSTINRYLALVADQQNIDQRLKGLSAYEKEVAAKQALLGDADEQELQILTHSEQIKLLKALVIQKVANNESATEAIAALKLIENKPPHPIKYDHLFSIPVLSEVADIIKIATLAITLIGGAMLVTLAVNPRFCGEQNGSQFCQQVNATYRYFYNDQQEQ